MSYMKIQSPAQAESDQKDIIIRQLKDDIMELKKTSENYFELNQSIANLENKFSKLDDERQKSQLVYRNKHETDQKAISNAKMSSESLSSAQRKKQVEVFELKGDNETFQNDANERTMKLNSLKQELEKNKEINTQLTGQKQKMEQDLEELQNEIKIMGGDLEQTQRKNDQSVLFKNDNEKNLQELGFQKNLMSKSFAQTQTQNVSLNLEDKTKYAQKTYLEQQRNTGSQTIDQLEHDISELKAMFDNQKQECARNLLQMKDEQSRGQDLTVRLQNLEALLKQRNLQVGDIRQENDRYRNENLELMNTNQQLSYDLESLKKYIDILIERNTQFLTDFDSYTKEDEQLSILLNRKYRVQDIRVKAEDKIRQALRLIQGDIDKSIQQ